jgi:ribosomal protein S18 acetylase RimI-like enzyme
MALGFRLWAAGQGQKPTIDVQTMDFLTMNEVLIRKMSAADAAAVARLATQLGYPATADEILRRFDRISGRRDAALLVAGRTGGNIVGWIHVQLTSLLESDDRAEIWGLVVDEAARGAGVGRRLVEAAEEWAAGRGIRVMVVRSNQVRVAAKGFYEHLGYVVTKTQNAFRKLLAV